MLSLNAQVEAILPAVLLLSAGIVSVVASHLARISSIVGFIVVGAVIGHGGLGLVSETPTSHLLAELGIVFLLFDIGLHFSARRIWAARRDVFGLGPIQMALCGGTLIGVLLLLGTPLAVCILAGGALALSSTAVVSRVLSEKGLDASPVGRSALAVLVVQDVFAIGLLVLLSADASGERSLPGSLGIAAMQTVAALAAALLLRRIAVEPVFALIARTRSSEAMTGFALLLVLSAATVTGAAGLSLTLGAFLAGMMIADTPYQYTVQTETKPFRELLLGFFFLSIGMSIVPVEVLRGAHWILLATLAYLLIKASLILCACLVVRTKFAPSIALALLLAQGSEFAFIILADVAVSEALGERLRTSLAMAVVLSLALTPWIAGVGFGLARRWCERTESDAADEKVLSVTQPSVIFGLGPAARRVSAGLAVHGIRSLIVESDFDRFAQARAEGLAAIFGDLADLRFADAIGVDERPMVIIPELELDLARRVAPEVLTRYPDLIRIGGVRNIRDQGEFERLGIVSVVDSNLPHGIDLAAKVLELHGVPRDAISRWVADEQRRAFPVAD
ncbi:MAG: cation:proton antiporter [Planctomycetota bacterium]